MKLNDSDLIKIQGQCRGWFRYDNSDIQRALSCDLGYKINHGQKFWVGADGVLHKEQVSNSTASSVNGNNHGFEIGADGVIHREPRHSTPISPSSHVSSNDSCLQIIVAFVLPFVVFFMLGGIAENIFFFFKPLEPDSSLGDIYEGRMFALSILSGLYNFILSFMDDNSDDSALPYIPIGFVFIALFCNILLTFDVRAIYIITSIVDIATMIFSGYLLTKKNN